MTVGVSPVISSAIAWALTSRASAFPFILGEHYNPKKRKQSSPHTGAECGPSFFLWPYPIQLEPKKRSANRRSPYTSVQLAIYPIWENEDQNFAGDRFGFRALTRTTAVSENPLSAVRRVVHLAPDCYRFHAPVLSVDRLTGRSSKTFVLRAMQVEG